VVIGPELPESLLKDLLRIGIYDETTVEEHVQNGAVDAQSLRTWAEGAVSEFRTDLERDIKEEFGADIDKIALFGKYLLNIFTGNGAEFSAEALAEPVDMNRFAVTTKPSDLDIDMSGFNTYGESLLGLFHARFHLRANMVDYKRLESHVKATSPNELCNVVNGMSAGILGFKIGPTRKETIDLKQFLTQPSHFGFRSIGRSLHEYAREDEYEETLNGLMGNFTELKRFYESADTPSDIDLSTVENAYDRLPSTYPPESVKTLKGLDEDEREEYDKALERIDDITEQLGESSSMWDFLSVYYDVAQLKYGALRDQFKLLKSFRDDLEELDGELVGRITELQQEVQIDIDTQPFVNCQQVASDFLDDLGVSK
jgi:hypothetical protein